MAGQGKKIQHRASPSSSSSSEEYKEEDAIPPTKTTATSSTVSQVQSLITDISEVIKSLDDDKLSSFYAVYYGPTYYWGKLRKCFSFDSDSDVDQVEMSFLRYRGNHCFDYPQTKDIETVDSKFVFVGPCMPDMIQGQGFQFKEDRLAKERFLKIKKLHYYS